MKLDQHLISGLFTALNIFAKESGKGAIDSLTLKEAKFIYENFGPIFVVFGCDPSDSVEKVKEIIGPIGNRFVKEFGEIKDWDGETKNFHAFSDILDSEFKFQDLKISEEEKIQPKRRIMYRIVIVGNPSVGKTALLFRFAENKFISSYWPTMGVDVIKHVYDLDSHTTLTFTAWDVSGQRTYKSLRKTYYPSSETFLIVYDVTNLESFQEINEWINEIRQYGKEDRIFVLVGNKIDLKDDRAVPLEEARKKSEELKLDHFEVSAKSGENVKDLFDFLGKKIIEIKIKKKT